MTELLSAPPVERKSAGNLGSTFALIASIAAGITVLLGLLGYGVALAAESSFGMPHALLFDSSFELLDLAGLAITQSIPRMAEALTSWALYRGVYTKAHADHCGRRVGGPSCDRLRPAQTSRQAHGCR